MDLKEDDIYKLFALGWNGKEDPINFLHQNYKVNFTYGPSMVNISCTDNNNSHHSLMLYHCPYTAKSRIINAALRYFKTENGKVLGPAYEYFIEDELEWT